MSIRRVTVFGGTGFLGRRIVARLLERGIAVRVAVRCPSNALDGRSEAVAADVTDADAVAAAVRGADAVVNAVALYVESGAATFRGVHVDGARNVAEAATRHGCRRLVQISGIGADAAARSRYVRARGRGEDAVREAFPAATILRPSVMFGPGDAFLTTLASLVRRLPVLPLFGRGDTRLQPVCVDDAAEAVARLLLAPQAMAGLREIGGPHVYSYRQILELIAQKSGHRRLFLPVPFIIWDALALVARLLPNPPLTEGQVALMKSDNVAAPSFGTMDELGISPTPLATALDGQASS